MQGEVFMVWKVDERRRILSTGQARIVATYQIAMDFKDERQEGHSRDTVVQARRSSLPQRAHRGRKDKIRNRQTLPAGTDCRSAQVRRHGTENRKRGH